MNEQRGEKSDAFIARTLTDARIVSTPHSGGAMTWRLWGSGDPLVLLHGGHGSWMHWIRNVAGLSRTHTVLVPDLPGFGESDLLAGEVRPDTMTEAVVAGIDSVIGEATPFAIAGFSFGGVVSGYVGATCGRRAKTVILVGSGGLKLPSAPRPVLAKWRGVAPGPALDEVHRANLKAFMLHRVASVDDLAVQIHGWSTSRARSRQDPADFITPFADALARLEGRLAGIWGEHDSTAAPYVAERGVYLASLQPDAPFHVVRNSGHWVQYEDPDEVDAQLLYLVRST